MQFPNLVKWTMNLTSLSEVRSLLGELNICPGKAMGQNFLIDRNILNILIEAAEIEQSDKVLEIGPGLGVVTEELIRMAGHVVAVEKDRRLFEFLRKRIKCEPKLEMICADMLDVNLDVLLKSGINKVVSNLPYSVGTRILVDLVKIDNPPDYIVVTVQMEVADRIVAESGSHDYGLLSVWSQLMYDVDLVKTISPTCFWPKPVVKSGIVKMIRRDRKVDKLTRTMLYNVTKYAFSHGRKQLIGILDSAAGDLNLPREESLRVLADMRIEPKARPAELSVDEWCLLSGHLAKRARK